MMRKGALPVIAIVLVILAGAMVTEGVYLTNFLKGTEVIKRSARETVVVSAANTVEFRKRALQNAVAYSFQTAANEILASGGFCSHAAGASQCSSECQVPSAVPTLGCVPWWKVYGSVYAPVASGGQGSFLAYLSNRTASIYSSYAQSISKGSMSYCPSTQQFELSSAGAYNARVTTSQASAAIQNRKDFKTGEATDTVVITESNTVFASTFGSSALNLYSFGLSNFASGNDAITSAFVSAASSMPSECKQAAASSVCENAASSAVCEAKLSAACTSDAAGSACDSNADGLLTADERYKCAAESALDEPVSSADGRLVASVSTDCVKTGHSSSFSGTTTHDCSAVLSKGCGCAQACTPAMCGCSAQGSTCGDCSACGTGANAEWVEHNSCTGNNNFDCSSFGADSCPSPCCSRVQSGQAPSGDPIYSCGRVSCADAGYASCPSQCGCGTQTAWTFSCSGLSIGCGLSNGCCISAYGVIEDAVCKYDYFGSATASVAVKDTKSAYLSGVTWNNPTLSFYTASGNAACSNGASDSPSEPAGACCAVTSTNAADAADGCKS
jgi:hypothetical protein